MSANTPNIPNTFQHPNWFIDELMHLLTPEENVILTFITRHIFGWERERIERQKAISLTMFEDGYTDEKGYRYNGTGLGRTAIISICRRLTAFGIIKELTVTDKGTLWELPVTPVIKWDVLRDRLTARCEKKAQTSKKIQQSKLAKRGGVHQMNGGSSDEREGVHQMNGRGFITRTESNPPNPPNPPIAASAGENAAGKTSQSTKAAKTPRPRKQDPVFNAIRDHLHFGGSLPAKVKSEIRIDYPDVTPVEIEAFACAYHRTYPDKHLPGWNKIASFFGDWKRGELGNPKNGNGAGEHPQPAHKLIRIHGDDCPNCHGGKFHDGFIATLDGMERCNVCWQRAAIEAVQS